jgi:3-hydroxy-3-methylglutaryl CoA synthase
LLLQPDLLNTIKFYYEYTQGAGASAMLLTANPRIISFENHWATRSKAFLISLNRTEPF